MKFTAIDAFSGAGGLSLGLMKAGFDIIYSFDKDPKSVNTQKLNSKYLRHPVECQDIDIILSQGIPNRWKNIFLLAGGPPCQGFSVQRIGEDDDDRNDLVLKFIKFGLILKPEFILMENVPGLKGKRGHKTLARAIELLEKENYSVCVEELDAQNFGVPQRRKRVFLLAERDWKLGNSLSLPNSSIGADRITVRQVIGSLPKPENDRLEITHHQADKLSQKNLARIRAIKEGQGRDFLPDELLANCHKRTSSQIGHRNVYGRMRWDEVAPTITARFDSFTRGQFGHPDQDRSISLREGALLQTFPIDFQFSGNKVEIARQIGNAVPVILAEAIGRHILKHYMTRLQMERNSAVEAANI